MGCEKMYGEQGLINIQKMALNIYFVKKGIDVIKLRGQNKRRKPVESA